MKEPLFCIYRIKAIEEDGSCAAVYVGVTSRLPRKRWREHLCAIAYAKRRACASSTDPKYAFLARFPKERLIFSKLCVVRGERAAKRQEARFISKYKSMKTIRCLNSQVAQKVFVNYVEKGPNGQWRAVVFKGCSSGKRVVVAMPGTQMRGIVTLTIRTSPPAGPGQARETWQYEPTGERWKDSQTYELDRSEAHHRSERKLSKHLLCTLPWSVIRSYGMTTKKRRVA